MTNTDMISTTRPFMSGRSQAVRIPAPFRFSDEELVINKIGDTVMITPRSKMVNTLNAGAAMIPDDFMNDGLPDEIPSKREEL